MRSTDEQLELFEQLRYHYFDDPKFKMMSDNVRFIECAERPEYIGDIPELSFLYTYLDYNYEDENYIDIAPDATRVKNLIQKKKNDPNINWDAIYTYLDEVKQNQWDDIIEDDINDALIIFEPFRSKITTISNQQQVWI